MTMVKDKKMKAELAQAFARSRRTLVNYRRILLVNDQENELLPADFHYTWSDKLLHGTDNEAFQGYRESAKTQYVIRSFLGYALTFPEKKRDFIVIIKKNQTLAENKLKEVEHEYLSNPAIKGNLVKIREQSGKVFSVDVEGEDKKVHNVRIEAYGKGASIRGLANIDRRPKIIIIDDPQDVTESQSDTIMETDWNWFLSDVMFLGKHSRIFLIGNNLGEKCIIERVFQNHHQLGFNVARIPVMDETMRPTWPAQNTIESIETEKENFRKLGKLDIWLREKMCQAVGDETRVFKKEDRRYFNAQTSRNIVEDANVYITIDPASSNSPESCLRAIVVNAVDIKNRWFVVDVPFGRWDSAELLDLLFEKVRQWNPLKVGIEKGMFKQIIEPFIYKEMQRRNAFFDIVPIEHAKAGSKLERVKMLAPRFRAHSIWLPEEAPWLSELESELDGVTNTGFKSLYVDLIDALAMQEQIAQAPYRKGSATNMRSLPRESVMEGTFI